MCLILKKRRKSFYVLVGKRQSHARSPLERDSDLERARDLSGVNKVMRVYALSAVSARVYKCARI